MNGKNFQEFQMLTVETETPRKGQGAVRAWREFPS
jgi:hypothetical protein